MARDEQLVDDLPPRDDTPDGEEARGSGAGIIGAGQPVIVGEEPPVDGAGGDLQDDMGRDPTLMDDAAGD